MPDGTHRAAFDTEVLTGVVQGTHIQTASGECRVERLEPGDCVVANDGSTAPITSISKFSFRASGPAAPVRVTRGSIGSLRDIAVAPDQVLSVNGALMSASNLPKHAVAEIAYGGMVTYYQLHFETDVLVTAEGVSLAFGKDRHSILRSPTAKHAQVSQAVTQI